MAQNSNGKIYSKNNRLIERTEPLINVAQLKERYLFGVGVKDEHGNPLPDHVYQNYINNAVSFLEHFLDISITPTCKVEYRDYQANDYWEWGYFQLFELPVISMDSLEVAYARNADGSDQIVTSIPPEWFRLDVDSGMLRLAPFNRFPAQLQVSGNGVFFPELFRRNSSVPALWKLQYTYGFDNGKIPVLLNQAISLLAAMQALTLAGHLVLGAGIAGTSLSLDGLSQSIQTTQSAENSAYSATRGDYRKALQGETKDDPHAILTVLHNYYKGATIQII